MRTNMKALKIGEKTAEIPIIQGGMGVGVSLGSLAGAVAHEGAVGIISTAQIGFYRDDFDQNPSESNLKAIHEQVQKAREIACGKGLIGVNVMVALKDYALHVTEAAKAGVDLIISGAGLPMNLPDLVKDYDVKLAPIVSSFRAARLIFNKWKRSYGRVPDLVVIEGPKAGGHLGFSLEELEQYGCNSAGNVCVDSETDSGNSVNAEGIFDAKDIDHAFELGASGVQMASRFVCTEECDASLAYKMAYMNAKEEDLKIIKSPVGMPGRLSK